MKEQQLTETESTKESPLKDEFNSQMEKIWKIFLTIFTATIIFILAIAADYLIIRVISWTFSDAVNKDQFVASLLEGIQKLSALGTALAYILYLISSLSEALKETRERLKKER